MHWLDSDLISRILEKAILKKSILRVVVRGFRFENYCINFSALEHAYASKICLLASFLTLNKMVKKFSKFRKIPIISELSLSPVILKVTNPWKLYQGRTARLNLQQFVGDLN